MGVLLLWHSLGAAAGSWMGGATYDDSGNYDHAIAISLASCAVAAVVLVVESRGAGEPLHRRPAAATEVEMAQG